MNFVFNTTYLMTLYRIYSSVMAVLHNPLRRFQNGSPLGPDKPAQWLLHTIALSHRNEVRKHLKELLGLLRSEYFISILTATAFYKQG